MGRDDDICRGHICTRETTERFIAGAFGRTLVFETLCGLKLEVRIGEDGSLEPDVAWYEFGPGDCDACMTEFIRNIPHLKDLVTPV